MTDNRWRGTCAIMLLITLLSLPGLAAAHNFVVGKAVSPIAISDGGELLLNDDDSIGYHPGTARSWWGKCA